MSPNLALTFRGLVNKRIELPLAPVSEREVDVIDVYLDCRLDGVNAFVNRPAVDGVGLGGD